MSLPKIVKNTQTVHFSPLFLKRMNWMFFCFLMLRDSTCTDTVVCMQKNIFSFPFLVKNNKKKKAVEICLPPPQKNVSSCPFDKLEVAFSVAYFAWAILQCRAVLEESIIKPHVISCCALRVDWTCCCLALHAIPNDFTHMCGRRLPSLELRQAWGLCV